MYGFFLSNQSLKESNQSIQIVSFKDFYNYKNIEKNCLYLFNAEEKAQILQRDDLTLYSIGTLIYDQSWGKPALVKIAHQLKKGDDLGNIISYTRGQFCLIIRKIKKTFVITDRLASFPIYKIEKDSLTQITNILPLLLKHNKLTLNVQSLAEYLSIDYCLDCTCFNEIETLKMATIYSYGRENNEWSYDSPLKGIAFDKHKKLNEATKLIHETFAHNISFLSNEDRPFADLTGGFDSRLLCAFLYNNKLSFSTGICGEQNLGESNYAKKVANILGVEFRNDYRINNQKLFEETIHIHKQIATGVPILYHSSEAINYYLRIKENHSIHLTGFGGTEMFQPWKKMAFSRKVPIKSLIDRYFSFLDIFPLQILNKDKYNNAITAKIRSLMDQTGSDIFMHTSNYIRFLTYTKWYHGALINTHNCILPLYSPYLESNMLRLLSEISFSLKNNFTLQKSILTQINRDISLVMTTHGCNANIDTKNYNLLIRSLLKDIARKMIYPFDFIRNYKKKLMKQEKSMAEHDRAFWVSLVRNRYSENLAIFQLINPKKVEFLSAKGLIDNKFFAKLIYINDLLSKYNIEM